MIDGIRKTVTSGRYQLISWSLRLLWWLTGLLPTALIRKMVRVWYCVMLRDRAVGSRGTGPVIFIAMPKSASKTIVRRLAAMLNTGVILIANKRGGQVWPLNSELDINRFLYALFSKNILHEHCRADNRTLRQFRRVTDHIIVHVRDPRQTLISMAHHFIDSGESLERFGIDPQRINDGDWEGTLDYLIDTVFPALVQYIDEWYRFSKTGDMKVVFLTYENFKSESTEYFSALRDSLGISYTHAMPEINVHLRLGEVAEWKRVLTENQQHRINSALPIELTEAFGWT